MSISNNYTAKIAELKTKVEEFKKLNEIDSSKLADLNSEYESYLVEVDFNNAETVKKKIKEVEAAIETRQDIIAVLEDKKSPAIIESAKKVVRAYLIEKAKLQKDMDKQMLEVEKKKNDYLNAISKVQDINREHFKLLGELGQVRNVTNWDSVELRNETGLSFSVAFDPTNRSLKSILEIEKELKDSIAKL